MAARMKRLASLEARFFAAVSVEYPQKTWAPKFEEPSALWDARGVDAIAWVSYPPKNELVPVPIQIKGDLKAVADFYALHPDAYLAGVVVIVIKSHHTPAHIREQTFSKLGEVRSKGLRFDNYLRQLSRKCLNAQGREIVRRIEKRRRLIKDDLAEAARAAE